MSADGIWGKSIMHKCQMCNFDVAHICDSHFIPQHVYRRARHIAMQGRSINYIDSRNDAYVLGKELKRHLLCAECEHQLKINGEDYFSKNCLPPADKSDVAKLFKLACSKLLPLWNDGGELAADISIGPGFASEIQMEALYYFAISIFWRGTFEWGSNYRPIEIDKRVKEEMRLYLFDKKSYPLNYQIEVVPAFWTPRFSVVFPTRIKPRGCFLFSIFSFDFYVNLTKVVSRFNDCPPITLLASPSRDWSLYLVLTEKHGDAIGRGKIIKNATWLSNLSYSDISAASHE